MLSGGAARVSVCPAVVFEVVLVGRLLTVCPEGLEHLYLLLHCSLQILLLKHLVELQGTSVQRFSGRALLLAQLSALGLRPVNIEILSVKTRLFKFCRLLTDDGRIDVRANYVGDHLAVGIFLSRRGLSR